MVTGCANYSKLSENERLVSYKLFSNETKYYIEKFDNKTGSWFKAKCNIPTKNFKDCINNTEFTEISKIRIEGLLSNDHYSINKNTNSNSENENSSNDEEDEDEEEDEEEDEDEDEDDWDEDDWT